LKSQPVYVIIAPTPARRLARALLLVLRGFNCATPPGDAQSTFMQRWKEAHMPTYLGKFTC
jgi:hypothetical protein